MLTMGDQKMEYNDDFRMFLTTKISNPNYIILVQLTNIYLAIFV